MNRRPPGQAARRRGMTLIELLLVMALLALMMGFGLGMIASMDLGTYGASGLVRGVLRSANQWAMARQATARVRLDPATGRVTAEGLAVVGTWQFEDDPPRAAFGLDGELAGAELVDDGFVGRALHLDPRVSEGAYLSPVQNDPAFDLTNGFLIQVALRPEGERRARLLKLGESLQLEVTQRQGLVLTVATQRYDEETGRPVSAGNAVLESPDAVLEPDRWNRVLVGYDRARFVIAVEGVELAALPEEAEVLPVKGPLVIGGGQRPWAGSVDSLVISVVGAQEIHQLPSGVQLAPDCPREVVFDAGGGLDRTVHPEPVVIEVQYDDGRTEAVRVNLYGTVE